MLFKKITICLLPIFFISCASIPENFTKHQKGQWTIKTLIQDEKSNRSHIVYAETMAEKPNKLRMEVSTTLGIHLATLVLDNKKIKYAVVPDKKYYYGKATKHSLKAIIPVAIHPEALVSILFDQVPENNWTCEKDKNSYLSKCKTKGLEVVWTKRTRQQRVVMIISKNANLQMQMKSFQPKDQFEQGTFELKPPKGFQKIRLRM